MRTFEWMGSARDAGRAVQREQHRLLGHGAAGHGIRARARVRYRFAGHAHGAPGGDAVCSASAEPDGVTLANTARSVAHAAARHALKRAFAA